MTPVMRRQTRRPAHSRAALLLVLVAPLAAAHGGAGDGSSPAIPSTIRELVDHPGQKLYPLPDGPACMKDAERLCSSVVRVCENPGCEVQCMAESPPRISKACRKEHPCAADIETLCTDMPSGPDAPLRCLRHHRRKVSRACKRAEPCIASRHKACDDRLPPHYSFPGRPFFGSKMAGQLGGGSGDDAGGADATSLSAVLNSLLSGITDPAQGSDDATDAAAGADNGTSPPGFEGADGLPSLANLLPGAGAGADPDQAEVQEGSRDPDHAHTDCPCDEDVPCGLNLQHPHCRPCGEGCVGNRWCSAGQPWCKSSGRCKHTHTVPMRGGGQARRCSPLDEGKAGQLPVPPGSGSGAVPENFLRAFFGSIGDGLREAMQAEEGRDEEAQREADGGLLPGSWSLPVPPAPPMPPAPPSPSTMSGARDMPPLVPVTTVPGGLPGMGGADPTMPRPGEMAGVVGAEQAAQGSGESGGDGRRAHVRGGKKKRRRRRRGGRDGQGGQDPGKDVYADFVRDQQADEQRAQVAAQAAELQREGQALESERQALAQERQQVGSEEQALSERANELREASRRVEMERREAEAERAEAEDEWRRAQAAEEEVERERRAADAGHPPLPQAVGRDKQGVEGDKGEQDQQGGEEGEEDPAEEEEATPFPAASAMRAAAYRKRKGGRASSAAAPAVPACAALLGTLAAAVMAARV